MLEEMLEEMHREVLENRKLFFPVLRDLSLDEITSIWDKVSEFIYRKLCMNKGVRIYGLGIFFFAPEKLDLGGDKFVMSQRPVFLLNEKICENHQLKQSKPFNFIAGEISVVRLNFKTVSLESSFKKDIIQDCVTETLIYFLRRIAQPRPIRLTFRGIGVLCIQNREVNMIFSRELLLAMNGSEDPDEALLNLLQNPETQASVLPERPMSATSSESIIEQTTTPSCVSSPLKFPSIVPKITNENATMETIKEDNVLDNKEKDQTQTGNDPSNNRDKNGLCTLKTPNQDRCGKHTRKDRVVDETTAVVTKSSAYLVSQLLRGRRKNEAHLLEDMHREILRISTGDFHTLRALTLDEITNVWDGVFEFASRYLSMNKGVIIPGLGIFSFALKKVDLGSNKFMVKQRPVFLPSQKLCPDYQRKKYKTYRYYPGEIPIVSLNLRTVSVERSVKWEIIQECMKETLQYISQLISQQRQVKFSIKGIGVLCIQNEKVNMTFSKDFLLTMERNWNPGNTLLNDSETRASVFSQRRESTVLRGTIFRQTTVPAYVGGPLKFPRIKHEETTNSNGTYQRRD